jgi:hypothetical protein
MRVVQGRVVLLMSMIRNEDDGDVGGTEKEKFINDNSKKCRHIRTKSCQGEKKFSKNSKCINMLSIKKFSCCL